MVSFVLASTAFASLPSAPRAARCGKTARAALRWLVAAAALVLVALAPPCARAEETAEPARLDASDERTDLPVPAAATQVTRVSGPVLRELKATVAADPAAVLAFYRRELGQRGWKEVPAGAADHANEIRRSFSAAEGTAVLVLGHAADATSISLVVRASEEVVAARALEAREAERAARGVPLADADAVQREAGDMASNLGRSSGILRPRANVNLPIPVPETAEAIALDGAAGRLTFTSGASVRALEIFYRGMLKAQGFAERPGEAHSGVAALEFVNGTETLLLTFAREGNTVTVTATGAVLQTAAR
ncbi:MAG: hypothetical protein ACLP8B_20505 [Xanthobacteraceae bacterium]